MLRISIVHRLRSATWELEDLQLGAAPYNVSAIVEVYYEIDPGQQGSYWDEPLGPSADIQSWECTGITCYDDETGDPCDIPPLTPSPYGPPGKTWGQEVEDWVENHREQLEAYLEHVWEDIQDDD